MITNLGHSCFALRFFPFRGFVSIPQITLESTEMTGKTFEQVGQVGRGLPSGPLGTAGFLDRGTASDTFVDIDGRARKTLVSGSSSVFTLTDPFPVVGVDRRDDAFSSCPLVLCLDDKIP